MENRLRASHQRFPDVDRLAIPGMPGVDNFPGFRNMGFQLWACITRPIAIVESAS